jgi:uncharacterized YccA/Bax inhibitor family protein
VQKTAFTLGLLVASAAATWFLIGDVAGAENVDNLARASRLMIIGALIGFALAMVNSFKRVVSPPLVLAYSVAQGVAMGAISKVSRAPTTAWSSVRCSERSLPSPAR